MKTNFPTITHSGFRGVCYQNGIGDNRTHRSYLEQLIALGGLKQTSAGVFTVNKKAVMPWEKE